MNPNMNIHEFAAKAGVSVSTIEKRLRRGEISCVRVGSRLLFTDAHLAEMNARFEVKAAPARRQKPVLAERA